MESRKEAMLQGISAMAAALLLHDSCVLVESKSATYWFTALTVVLDWESG